MKPPRNYEEYVSAEYKATLIIRFEIHFQIWKVLFYFNLYFSSFLFIYHRIVQA